MPKLQKYKNGFFVTIPKEHVAEFGWTQGTDLYVTPTGHGDKKLIIKEKIA